MLAPRGRTHSKVPRQRSKNSSTSGRLASTIARVRATTWSSRRSATSARISLGALLQMVV